MTGYIYVINVDGVFGIGNSSSIPEGHVLEMLIRVDDAIRAERAIITRLKDCTTLLHRPSIECYERFDGNLDTIISIVTQTIAMLNAGKADVEVNPLISFIDNLCSKK